MPWTGLQSDLAQRTSHIGRFLINTVYILSQDDVRATSIGHRG